ncbi:putative multiple-sugar transport system permease YteP [Pullulanibacillus pueri]|uniref:Putative multiple-sugar transport system permease YteP n=2 Tax=Pullulanibacillus pueri TaxID=1437324 RepID=A0A8J2ZVV5_9BACL|nr:putative multiple-sugar transport system permease YteP [Pullulanibacillus pueri]
MMDLQKEKEIKTPVSYSSKIRRKWRDIWKYKAMYLMLLPGLIWFIIYKYVPLYGVIVAFKNYSLVDGMIASPWAHPWYKYFQTFFNSPYFTELLSNTFLISFYRLIFGFAPPIILALLLNECRISWMKRWVQTLSYIPHFFSWVIVYGILVAFLSQSTGLINHWIVESGGNTISFLTSTHWFRSILVSSDVWKEIGWGSIIYLAAITGINPSLYEAAKIDGANRMRMIWHITLPGIRNIIILLFILRIGHILDAGFEEVYILYNIQVYPVADIIDTWVYRTGLQQLNFSLATAVGLFKSVIGLILVLGVNRLAKRWGGGIW